MGKLDNQQDDANMYKILVLLCFAAQTNAWFLSSDPKPGDPPRWEKLSVKFGLNIFTNFLSKPQDISSAKSDGWVQTRACDEKAYFRGNRYVLKGDTAVMLLFDKDGKIAGIQLGIKKSDLSETKTLPWNVEGDMYVMTAYFVDPQTICSGGRAESKYIGDTLLIQTGLTPDVNMKIPIDEGDLKTTKWVKGGCFYGMGQHYWYDISPGMSCDKFYPVFLLYEDARLTGFGWNTRGFVQGTFEHPVSPGDSTSKKQKTLNFFFGSGQLPTCLLSSGPLTTQHVYLNKRPYLNGC